jgi:hypothetical protein
MGKARRKSTARIPLSKAPELAAKRLSVDDLDYAKIRLCEQLKTAKFGRDWGMQAVHPPGTRVDDLWCDPSGAWAIDWENRRASMSIGSGLGFERATVYGLWIAPAVVAALSSVMTSASRHKRKQRGTRRLYDIPRLKRTMREIRRELMAATPGQPVHLDGKGGVAEKLRDRLGDDAVPERSRLYQIYALILPAKQSTN